jgi:hypothetical protein
MLKSKGRGLGSLLEGFGGMKLHGPDWLRSDSLNALWPSAEATKVRCYIAAKQLPAGDRGHQAHQNSFERY